MSGNFAMIFAIFQEEIFLEKKPKERSKDTPDFLYALRIGS